MFGSIIFQQLYNIADSLVAGKFIGENALAAVGNSYDDHLIFIAFAFGCNIGARSSCRATLVPRNTMTVKPRCTRPSSARQCCVQR